MINNDYLNDNTTNLLPFYTYKSYLEAVPSLDAEYLIECYDRYRREYIEYSKKDYIYKRIINNLSNNTKNYLVQALFNRHYDKLCSIYDFSYLAYILNVNPSEEDIILQFDERYIDSESRDYIYQEVEKWNELTKDDPVYKTIPLICNTTISMNQHTLLFYNILTYLIDRSFFVPVYLGDLSSLKDMKKSILLTNNYHTSVSYKWKYIRMFCKDIVLNESLLVPGIVNRAKMILNYNDTLVNKLNPEIRYFITIGDDDKVSVIRDTERESNMNWRTPMTPFYSDQAYLNEIRKSYTIDIDEDNEKYILDYYHKYQSRILNRYSLNFRFLNIFKMVCNDTKILDIIYRDLDKLYNVIDEKYLSIILVLDFIKEDLYLEIDMDKLDDRTKNAILPIINGNGIITLSYKQFRITFKHLLDLITKSCTIIPVIINDTDTCSPISIMMGFSQIPYKWKYIKAICDYILANAEYMLQGIVRRCISLLNYIDHLQNQPDPEAKYLVKTLPENSDKLYLEPYSNRKEKGDEV